MSILNSSPLFCNHSACHASLGQEFYVTDCSHAFCIRCMEAIENPICLVCSSELSKDSVRLVTVPDTADWTSNPLVGLNPNDAMELARVSLSFWPTREHQQGQVIASITSLFKQEREGWNAERNELLKQKFAHELAITTLEAKVTDLTSRNQELTQKLLEIEHVHAETKRQYSNLKTIYSTSRQRNLLQHTASTASGGMNALDQLMADAGTPGSASFSTKEPSQYRSENKENYPAQNRPFRFQPR